MQAHMTHMTGYVGAGEEGNVGEATRRPQIWHLRAILIERCLPQDADELGRAA